jgi:hypothetical protein
VLKLVLGPLHLRLLGLAVHLKRVHLTFTAIRGRVSCPATCCAPLPAC